ncbi:transposable element Tcb2 transposase [Trichonephila clavipes]|nr:transposable element Tcb2 transposase [Trichonephila clavipes]
MHPRRNKEKFQQLTEFVLGRIIGLTEGGFSYHAIGPRVQRNSSTVMQIWKQWTDELRITRKTGSERHKSWFNLWNHNGRICVRRYAGERCLPVCVIERYSGLTLEVKASLELSLSRIMHARELQKLFETSVQPNTCNFFLGLSAYSPDMSPIEQVGDLVGRCLARDPYPASSKNELLLRIQAIWNSFPQSGHSKSV